MKKDFVIYTKMLGVITWLFQKVNAFPKKQRFVLGQQIETSALACLRYIVEANNAGAGPQALLASRSRLEYMGMIKISKSVIICYNMFKEELYGMY